MHLLRRRSQPLPGSPSRDRVPADLLSAGHGASSSKFDRPLFKLSAETPRSKEALLGADAGSHSGSDSHLMNFSAELAVLQRGNQRHASRYSNFVASAEWVGYRERK